MKKKEGTATSPGNISVPNAYPVESADEKKFQYFFEQARNTRNTVCPVRDIISRISDKWTLLAIYALRGYGVLRFNELKHKIGDVSQRMLTVSLRNLEKDGFLTRRLYAEVPPRVEYELTPLGISLANQLVDFVEWANDNGKQILNARKKA